MKKEYSSPELDLIEFSFESILQGNTVGVNVSDPEGFGDDHSEFEGDW